MSMIDWVTAIVPCRHLEYVFGSRVMKIDPNGVVEWEAHHHLEVIGSHDAKIRIRTHDAMGDGTGIKLHVTGNLAKWLQGHNLFGTDDVITLVTAVMERLCHQFDYLQPTDFDRQWWRNGVFELTRLDITSSYSLDTCLNVRSFLRSAERTAHLRYRGRGNLMQEGTLYFGQVVKRGGKISQSRRWSLKMYSKGDELKAGGHELPDGIEQRAELLQWAEGKLRIELTVRSMELKRLYLNLGINATPEKLRQLFTDKLRNLDMQENHTLTPELLDGLPSRLQAIYALWKQGTDIRAMYPRATAYRYRKDLLEHGIDIFVKQESNKPDMTNVVPLVRVLEAKPATIPEWAKGTSLYFDGKDS